MLLKIKILGILFLSIGFFPVLASAQEFNKIFYYVEGKKSSASFEKNAPHIDIVAPQAYGVNAKGDLSGGPTEKFLEVARKHGVKIMPLVVNGGFSSSTLGKILDDKKIQDKIVKAMIEEAKKEGYIGWQFDFEQMTADRRDQYSAFVKRAYPQFRKEGLVFSVAVIAQFSENPADYPKNLWHRVIGAYDYQVLGENSDFLSLMTYDQADSKGPVASFPWVKKVVQFAMTKVPPNKLSLGIPFYFWKWDQATGKLVDIGGYGRVAELIDTPQVIRWGWDPSLQVAFVDYFYNRKKYTTWYENAKSFSSKMDLVKYYKLHGFSAWTLGLEDPKIYEVVKTREI